MLQNAIKISIPRRHIEQSVAREAGHLAGFIVMLAQFGPRLATVAAGYLCL